MASSEFSERGRLAELARFFLRLGLTAFGGPAAHIAMMEDEVVVRRRWLSREEFVDLLGVTNLIPGPNSTELAIHIGRRRAGIPGLIVAGVCFILPAFVLVLALAALYGSLGHLPQVGWIMYGIKPVIIAVVLQALVRFGQTVLRSPLAFGLCAVATVASLLDVSALAILGATGAGVALVAALRGSDRPAFAALPFGLSAMTGVAPAVVPFSLSALFLFFLKVGSVLFGSGYVLLAFLRADLVEHWHWLSESQLLDAVAVGQFTPGPVFTTATFIGYLLGGVGGSALATVGIFLPGFVFVWLTGPIVRLLRGSRLAAAFLDGINVASLALMAAVSWQLGRAAVVDLPTALLTVTSAAALLRFRINSAWFCLGGGLIGLLLRSLA